MSEGLRRLFWVFTVVMLAGSGRAAAQAPTPPPAPSPPAPSRPGAQPRQHALYTFAAGVAASLTTRTQLKVELLDTYASRPPTAAVKSNDVALLTGFVSKF